MNVKGILPLLILQVLDKDRSYGYQILIDIRDKSKGVLDYNEGALYPVLYQLERDGFVESQTEIVDGRARRFYHLTSKGRSKLAEERDGWLTVSRAITLILEEASI
jgi:PadR family transcriptional regulator, regulatory protein PadR